MAALPGACGQCHQIVRVTSILLIMDPRAPGPVGVCKANREHLGAILCEVL